VITVLERAPEHDRPHIVTRASAPDRAVPRNVQGSRDDARHAAGYARRLRLEERDADDDEQIDGTAPQPA
jgi:hypothetical protein